MMFLRRLFGLAALGLLVILGCSRDTRLSGQKIPDFKVGPVTHYGLSLDQQASPEQVAYAVLRAIREDVEAADVEARQAALNVQFDLCAASVIQARNRSSMLRNEFIFRVVKQWAPTVSYYASSFVKDWTEAQARLVRRDRQEAKSADECEMVLQVEDPSGNPNARAVLVIWLSRDAGFWRVVHLGFDPYHRTIDS